VLLGLVLAAAGILSPLLAAGVHVTSEMIFILNSARLLPAGGTQAIGSGRQKVLVPATMVR
jgi:hypothetical protein